MWKVGEKGGSGRERRVISLLLNEIVYDIIFYIIDI